MNSRLIPQPRKLVENGESFALKPTARIVTVGAALPAAELLAEYLRVPTGYDLPIVSGPVKTGDLVLQVTGSDIAAPVIATGCLKPGHAALVNLASGSDGAFTLITAAVEWQPHGTPTAPRRTPAGSARRAFPSPNS